MDKITEITAKFTKTMFQMDGQGLGQIIKRENEFISVENLKRMESYAVLENYYTTIAGHNIPINVLRHVTKHFENSTNREKIEILESILDYENNGSSYVIYSNDDNRFKYSGVKVKITKRYIQILKNNKLYEIATIESVVSPKVNFRDIKQVSSYYEIDPSWGDRHKKLEFSDIIDSHFNSEAEKYFIFVLTRDERLKTEKPLEIIENENQLMAQMMKAHNISSIDMGLAVKDVDVMKIDSKIDSDVLEIFFETMKDQLTVEELMKIYTTNTLPKLNLETAAAIAVKHNVLEIGSLLYAAISIMIKHNKGGIAIDSLFFMKKDKPKIMELVRAQIDKFNELVGQSIVVIHNDCIMEKIQLEHLEEA